MNWYKFSKIKLARTLYHGTVIDNLSSIRTIGLTEGDLEDENSFVIDAYSGSYDDESWEYMKNQDITIPVFMTDKDEIGRAVTAMRHHVSKKLNKTYHDVTSNDIRNHGLLVIIKDPEDDVQRAGEEPHPYEQESYLGIEPYDYYADRVRADGFLFGNKLIEFLNKNGYRIIPDKETKSRLEGWDKGKEIATTRKHKKDFPLFQHTEPFKRSLPY